MDDVLRQVLDETIVIRVRHELEPYQQKLLARLGADYVIDENAEPCALACGHEECHVSSATRTNQRISALGLGMASLGSTPVGWKPNWIDYRSSVANVARREDRGDTAGTCRECGCETDIAPAPHSPKCPTLNGGDMDGLDLLERMDAGEPLSDDQQTEIAGAEPEEIEEREPEADEATVAGADDSASAQADQEPAEPSRSSSSNGGGRSKWTREKVIAAIHEVAAKVGHTPSRNEMQDHGYGGVPQKSTTDRLGASWADLVREAGYEPLTRGSGAERRKDSGRDGRAPQRNMTAAAGASPAKADGKQHPRPGWLKVPDTGLAYRTPEEAYVAAAEACGASMPDGPDACLGTIPGVSHACCGHGGACDPYVTLGGSPGQPAWQVKTVTLRGEAATKFFALVRAGEWGEPHPDAADNRSAARSAS